MSTLPFRNPVTGTRRVRYTSGTTIPAKLRPSLEAQIKAQALREAAHELLERADRLDGKASRVTFEAQLSGLCGSCGAWITGAICPDCAPRGRA